MNYLVHQLELSQRVHMSQMRRLEASRLETARRAARWNIVAAAEQIWEGIDPAPDLLYDHAIGTTYKKHRDFMPTAQTFKNFRERFAPTHLLKEFLFPAHSLSEYPTLLPLNSATGFMPDPTMVIVVVNSSDSFDAKWIAEEALIMLQYLVEFKSPHYHQSGWGGAVSTWVKAATDYHISRFEKDLETGMTVKYNDFVTTLDVEERYRHLFDLKIKSGLKKEGATTMIPMPEHPVRRSYLENPSEEHHRLERVFWKAERERASAIKTFNKLARHTARACPISAKRFPGQGFEALMMHMIAAHPIKFWTSDEWHSLG